MKFKRAGVKLSSQKNRGSRNSGRECLKHRDVICSGDWDLSETIDRFVGIVHGLGFRQKSANKRPKDAFLNFKFQTSNLRCTAPPLLFVSNLLLPSPHSPRRTTLRVQLVQVFGISLPRNATAGLLIFPIGNALRNN